MFDTLKYHRSPEYKDVQKKLEEALSPEEYERIKKGNRKAFWKDTIVDSGICGALLAAAFYTGYMTRTNELLKAKINETRSKE
jgi:hypothetical protein